MRIFSILSMCLLVAGVAHTVTPAAAAGRFLAPPDQVVAVKAGQLYDAQAGQLLANQIVIIKGDRIADIGGNVQIPQGAKVIDLSNATVLPGMIDVHVHVVTRGDTPAERAFDALSNAQLDLDAGFTTLLDMDSRGGFNTVDLRNFIDAGVVQGPRMQVVGQSLNNRDATMAKDPETGRYYSGRTEGKDVNGPWLARAAVREAKNHGVDYIKIYTTQDFIGETHLWWPDGSFKSPFSLTLEETQAIVDESHRLGLKVACHSYNGTADDPCLLAGVDAPNHLLQLDNGGIRIIKEKHLIYVPTIDDLISLDKEDLEESHGRNSRLRMLETAFRRAHAAGLEMAFGSGATSPVEIPHGKQANQFGWYVKWGMTPVEALRTTFITSPRVLNYHWEREIGTLEKGKFADIIAVAGNPVADISELERVTFVMKGGMIVRDNQSVGARRAYTSSTGQ